MSANSVATRAMKTTWPGTIAGIKPFLTTVKTKRATATRTESAFARYGGLAPIPQWSGSTAGRLGASSSGNRQINTAIHRIAVVQIRLDCAGRDYHQRRRAEGDSGATALRC